MTYLQLLKKTKLTTLQKNITFIKEEEHDNKLAFLDVLFTKTDDGNLNTQVYQKKTHTDQLLNYNSNHLTQHSLLHQNTIQKNR